MSTPDPQVKILFVGDMHLGVLPSHIPPHLAETRQLRAHDLGPQAAWKRVIDAAIEHEVHAVALAGDLVDGNNALFEAFGLLETGLRRLQKAGIPVVAVAGNHDTEALPRLAEMIETLHLLGPGGTWSSHLISGENKLKVCLTGWSFPRRHVDTSPLPAPAAHAHHPTFGLLHADLDQSSSLYAPVSSQELHSAGYRAWFLGHIHLPGAPNQGGQPFYLGSVTGLHPGETGLHGPVLVKINAQEKLTMQRLPLAPLRWENIVIASDELGSETIDLLPLLLHHIDARAQALGDSLVHTRALGFRVTLTGTMDNPSHLRKAIDQVMSTRENLVTDRRGTVLFIDKIFNQTTLGLNLLAMARDESPEGLLAQRILVLEHFPDSIPGVDDPEPMREILISQGRQALAQVDGQTPYLNLQGHLETEEIAAQMAQSGRRALEEILSRKEVGYEAG